jgi:hypothetical protein
MKRVLRFAIVVLAAAVASTAPAFATTVSYTTQASFLGAITGATTANFDADVAGTLIPNGTVVDGITLSSTLGGMYQLAIANAFDTTSGLNYLGTTDATSGGALFASDSVTMTFGSPVSAVGLYILLGNSVSANTFTLNIAGGSALNSATQDTILVDGTYAYYIGITSPSSFSTATIKLSSPGMPGDGPTWNVDDITTGTAGGAPPAVPEPATCILFASGLSAMLRRRKQA